MTVDELVKRIDASICMGQAAIAAEFSLQADDKFDFPRRRALFRTSGLAVLTDLFGASHVNVADFTHWSSSANSYGLKAAVGILTAVRTEVQNGWLTQTRSLIAAEVFTDFLEMAEHLLTTGYKVAAAVVAGASLEAHLRRLCTANSIDIETPDKRSGKTRPIQAETLNQELMKKSVYGRGELKDVTAWLDTRNDAAHGHTDRVIPEKVDLVIQGIRLFMSRFPA